MIARRRSVFILVNGLCLSSDIQAYSFGSVEHDCCARMEVFYRCVVLDVNIFNSDTRVTVSAYA